MKFGLNFLSKFVLILLALCISALPVNAVAWSSVTILTTNNTPAITEFVQHFRSALSESNADIKLYQATNEHGLTVSIPQDTLVVAVGTQALNYASNLDERTPVLGLLVPKLSYERILRDSGRKPRDFSAIYLDQPFDRQISLLKKVFPNAKTISVILGPTSQFNSNDIQQAAKRHQLSVNIQLIDKAEDIQSILNTSLSDKSPILAVPDALVFNRETAQTFLLSSYRHRVPLVGFSQSYVNSGAIAATFSSPKQIGTEAAELIGNLALEEQTNLPAARFPKLFSIDFNQRVARALGIFIPNETTTVEAMLKEEKE